MSDARELLIQVADPPPLLPPDKARRCWCGKPNTTGLCAYPPGKCPREKGTGE